MQLSVALFSDILVEYFNSRNKFDKSIIEFNLQSIIENPKNKIIVTKGYIDFLETIFNKESLYYDSYTNFFTEIFDNDLKCEIQKLTKAETIESEFVNMANNCQHTSIAVSIKNKGFTLLNYVYIENYYNCLKTKLFIDILKDRKHISRYSDFISKSQIVEFFNSLYNLPRRINSVVIFERYANVNHTYFDFFNDHNIEVKYYKLNASLVDSYALKKKFKKVSLYNTSNQDLIHERSIIFDNFVINLDEDPCYLDANRKTWTIAVEYSSKTVNDLTNKCKDFNKMACV